MTPETPIDQFGIESLPEFDSHELVSLFDDNKIGLKGFVAIHRKCPEMPSFGATRMWCYGSRVDALRDALRLAKLMSYKSALAGLKCGGAKGVIIIDPNIKKEAREKVLKAYAKKVNILGGSFVTGTDVGLLQEDLNIMRKVSKHIVGFNDNSTEFTALGVYVSIKECLDEIFGKEDMKGKSFAIQGMGKVGSEILKMIYKEAGKIYIAEINPQKLKNIKKRFPKTIIVEPQKIHKMPVDVFVPCALNGSLNRTSVGELKCKIIAGCANNQLENEKVGDMLYKRGILYAPDYVVNAGGLIAVVNEFENKNYNKKKLTEKVLAVRQTLHKIFDMSRKQKKATNLVANQMAEDIFNKYNSYSK
jgi:leucine dehydrogenase